jgi:hypothetical protein
MKISITGSREFDNYDFFKIKLLEIIQKENLNNFSIVSGGAKGIDLLAKQFAIENKIEIFEILPDWKKYGKSAGLIRNKEIIEKSDFNIIFWNSKSKGTKFNIDYCIKNNKKFIVISI